RYTTAIYAPYIPRFSALYPLHNRHKYSITPQHISTEICIRHLNAINMHRNYIRIRHSAPICPLICIAICIAITSVYAPQHAPQSIRIHVIHPYTRNPSANNAHTSPPTKRAYDPSYAAQYAPQYAAQYATESIRHRTPTTVNIVRFIVLSATPAD